MIQNIGVVGLLGALALRISIQRLNSLNTKYVIVVSSLLTSWRGCLHDDIVLHINGWLRTFISQRIRDYLHELATDDFEWVLISILGFLLIILLIEFFDRLIYIY